MALELVYVLDRPLRDGEKLAELSVRKVACALKQIPTSCIASLWVRILLDFDEKAVTSQPICMVLAIV